MSTVTNNNSANVSVSISLPVDLVSELFAFAKSRDLSVAAVIEFQLKNFLTRRVPRTLKLNDTMPFGKFSGYTIEAIIRNEPGYAAWMLENITSTSFAGEVYDLFYALDCDEDPEISVREVVDEDGVVHTKGAPASNEEVAGFFGRILKSRRTG